MWKMKRLSFFNVSGFCKRLSSSSSSKSLQHKIAADQRPWIQDLWKAYKNPSLGMNAVVWFLSGLVGAVTGYKSASFLEELEQPTTSTPVEEVEIEPVSIEKDKLKFEEWMRKCGRTYYTPWEKRKRFLIFQKKLRKIEAHNRSEMSKSYTIGLNDFSDLTGEEIASRRCGLKLSKEEIALINKRTNMYVN